MFKGASYGSKMPPGWGRFYKKRRIIQMGFIFKTIRRGEISYYLTIRETIIVYIAVAATIYHICFINNIRISKKCRRAPSPLHTPTHCEQRHRSLANKNVSTPQHSQHPKYIVSTILYIPYCWHCTLKSDVICNDIFQMTEIYRWNMYGD